VTPPFTRLGLGGSGVVLPLTVEEYHQQRKMKRVEGKPTSLSETLRLRTRSEKRRSGSSHGNRRPSISSKRGTVYVLPPVASVFSVDEPLSDEGEKDVKDSNEIAKLGVKKVEDLARAFENKSPDAQDHADCCGRGGADTTAVIENARPRLTETKKQGVGPVSGCCRFFDAIFVRRPKSGSAEISRQATGSKACAQKIKTTFTNIIRK